MQGTHVAIGLTLCLASACTPARVVTTPAPAVAGDRIRYAGRSDTAEFVTGRLVSLDADSLVFERFVMDNRGSGRWLPTSLATDSIARLQVRVGRRGNPGRGAVIGGLTGLALGFACSTEEEGWGTPTPEQCVVSGAVVGAATGLVIGLLIRSDVWAPSPLPTPRPPAPGPATVSRASVGFRVPIRLP